MDEVPFKPWAYEKAAYAVTALDRPLAAIYAEGGKKALDALPGIGKGIAERSAGMLETGKMADLEELRKKTPVDILALTAIEGLGAKKARALWQALRVRSVSDLKKAAERGRIRTLPHFGERSEQKILEAITFYEEAAGRRPLGEILEIARRIEAALARVAGVVHAAVAGSIPTASRDHRRCRRAGCNHRPEAGVEGVRGHQEGPQAQRVRFVSREAAGAHELDRRLGIDRSHGARGEGAWSRVRNAPQRHVATMRRVGRYNLQPSGAGTDGARQAICAQTFRTALRDSPERFGGPLPKGPVDVIHSSSTDPGARPAGAGTSAARGCIETGSALRQVDVACAMHRIALSSDRGMGSRSSR
jgi:hypothetical protein